MGVLVRLHKKLAQGGGDVKLAALQGTLANLLSMVRLDRVFEMYPTVEDALRAFETQ